MARKHHSTEQNDRSSLKPIPGANRRLRQHLGLRGEFALALLPTVTILLVLGLVEVLSRQRLLFASLASSAFLIYLDPQHGTNAVRTLVTAHLLSAMIGFATFLALGPGYSSAGAAILLTITMMILLDVVHPPAVSTSLSFALRSGNENNLVLFGLAVGITALLVLMERFALWILAHYTR